MLPMLVERVAKYHIRYSHGPTVEAKANIFFDECRLFFVFFACRLILFPFAPTFAW